MIGRMLYGAAGAALVTATALLAQAPQSTDSKADANKQICRTFADTGTRLGQYRACHTAQEWAELRRQTSQNVDHIQNSRAMNSDPRGQ